MSFTVKFLLYKLLGNGLGILAEDQISTIKVVVFDTKWKEGRNLGFETSEKSTSIVMILQADEACSVVVLKQIGMQGDVIHFLESEIY
jgi:uncharacterized protein YeaC (DUF1315 family)